MKPLTLDEIKQAEFQLLKTLDNFCRQHHIRYFLSNGTLLGAVKYKGFIPWDDDLDVLVPREDYDRLISVFEDDDRVRLVSHERETKYLYPFAKLCDISTVKDETTLNNGITLGLNVDIFPLDAWNNELAEAKKEVRYIRRNIFFLVLTKLKKADSVNLVKRMAKSIVMAFCKMLGSQYFMKKILKASFKKPQNNNKYLGCKAWCIYGESEIIPADVFESTVEVEFEGEMFPAPIGYDTYLRSLYGDYRKDPPVEKQKTHHNFKAFRL